MQLHKLKDHLLVLEQIIYYQRTFQHQDKLSFVLYLIINKTKRNFQDKRIFKNSYNFIYKQI